MSSAVASIYTALLAIRAILGYEPRSTPLYRPALDWWTRRVRFDPPPFEIIENLRPAARHAGSGPVGGLALSQGNLSVADLPNR